MRNLQQLENPYGDDKVIANCCIFGMMNLDGYLAPGERVVRAIANMHDRGNGLGGGLAVYGLYPDYEDCIAFHVMYTTPAAKQEVENLIRQRFNVVHEEEVPTRPTEGITDPPVVWRYFVRARRSKMNGQSEDEFVIDTVMKINAGDVDAFVFSSGRNMAVFKGVGYPEDIARYFRLEEYRGYLWTAHGRFPTNSQAWWGGAHPFNLLDWTVVHNGEVSSYGTNRRYLEMHGYKCTMGTDTEVLAYAVDLLARRHGLPLKTVMDVFAPPLWTAVDQLGDEQRMYYTLLRQTYKDLLINGPFAVIIAHHGEMIAHTDRIRLRPLVAGIRGNTLYISSEEAAIRLVSPYLDRVWIPVGGAPIIGRLKNGHEQDAGVEYHHTELTSILDL